MKVAIMCNTRSSEYPNRPELIEDFIRNGDEVFFAAIDDGEINSYFSEGKAQYLPVLASRNNTNPIVEIKSMLDVKKRVKEFGIDAVLVYGVKNHAAMAIGAWLGGVRNIICMVNGRGNLFTVKGFKGKVLRFISFPMLKIAYGVSAHVSFQNQDDSAFFVEKKLLKKNKVAHTNGSGVNTEVFRFSAMPQQNEFLYLARITPSKGLIEYVEAARIVKEKYPDTLFHVVGPIDTAVEDSVKDYLDSAVADGCVVYHGKTDDVLGWLTKTRFFVYPSYHEGVPRCVLQAMSCGRPIITSDAPGCRDTVVEGKNGFLTEPRDYKAIAEKMELLLNDADMAEKMGRESRKLAEQVYDIKMVNKQIISLVNEGKRKQ